MDLFRVFNWDGRSQGEAPRGPFCIARDRQGAGRHDIPERDGALYGSVNPVSAVAEAIQMFRNQILEEGDFERENGLVQALAHFRLAPGLHLVDLNDPVVLKEMQVRPSEIATLERPRTQAICRRLHEKGVAGFTWWSTLEASWVNATLFQSRIRRKLKLAGKIIPLTIELKEVREAARWLKIRLKKD